MHRVCSLFDEFLTGFVRIKCSRQHLFSWFWVQPHLSLTNQPANGDGLMGCNGVGCGLLDVEKKQLKKLVKGGGRRLQTASRHENTPQSQRCIKQFKRGAKLHIDYGWRVPTDRSLVMYSKA